MGICDNIKKEVYIIGHAKSLSKKAMSKINKQMDNSVCKIIKEKSTGTGFICTIPFPNKLTSLPVLITCNHVLGNKELEIGKEIKLTFNENERIIKIDQSRKIYTSDEKEYDISIIELKSEDKFDLNNLLEVENDIFNIEMLNKEYKKKSIYIIHYPRGNEVEFSVDTIQNIDAKGIKITHCCSTDNGSSGGPILSLETFRILSIHIGKDEYHNCNIGTILKFPINEFNKKYKNNLNQKIAINLRNSNNVENNKNDILNIEKSIDIEILDRYICTITYKFDTKNIKELGFFVKISISNSTNSITGFLTKYHIEEDILNNIKKINIININGNIDKLYSENIFYFSDEFLGSTFIEIKNLNFDFIDISDKNKTPKKLSLINYSYEENSFKYTQGRIVEKLGINIIYKEEEDIHYYDYKTSYYNVGLFDNNKLIGIQKQNSYKDKIAINIDIISKAINLNYFSKIKNNSKNLKKNLPKELINELKIKGLNLTNIPNIFISNPSLFVTPIWFYRTKHAWYWTPKKPDKDDLNKVNWMIIYPKNSLKVIGGYWDGIKPAQRNIDLIHWLETTELKYCINFNM